MEHVCIRKQHTHVALRNLIDYTLYCDITMGFMHNFSLYYNFVKMLSFFLHTQPHVATYYTETGNVDIGDQMVCIIG